MKLILFTLLSTIFFSEINAQTKYINPTGEYKLKSKIKKKEGDIYGYSGYIQVKKLNTHKILIRFEVNKGAPSYNSGSFVDTLDYENNLSIYTNKEIDTTCKMIFYFRKDGILVKEQTADYNFGCGFGHAVVADGFYKKISNKEPTLREPLTGIKLE